MRIILQKLIQFIQTSVIKLLALSNKTIFVIKQVFIDILETF